MTYDGLTPGTTYYVAVGAASGTTGSVFTLCIQNLLAGGCAYTQPAGGFDLCSTFKSTYRGTSSNGVSYTYNFAGVGGGATGISSLSGTNLINLSSSVHWFGVWGGFVGAGWGLT